MPVPDLARLPDGRIVDTSPMDNGDNPKVLTPEGTWVDIGDITFGTLGDAIPLSEEEIRRLTRSG